MKKLLIAVTVVLLLAVCLLPGAMGFWLENNVHRQASLVAELQPGSEVVMENFERGWFASTVSQQVMLKLPAATRSGSAASTRDQTTVRLLIDSDIRHGPVLGAALPGLAVATSRIRVEIDGEGSWFVPGQVVTHVGLDTSGHSRYRSSPDRVSLTGTDIVVDWGGADIEMRFERGFSAVEGGGHIGALTTQQAQGKADIGPIDLSYALHRDNPHGFWLGTQHYDVAHAAYTDPASGQSIAVRRMLLDTSASEHEGLIDSSVDFSVAELAGAGLDAKSLHIAVNVRDLDADSLAELQSAAQRMQRGVAGDPGGAGAQPDLVEAMMLGPLLGILRGGPSLEIETAQIMLPQGPVTLNLNLLLARLPVDAVVNPVDVLTRMSGDGRLAMSKQVLHSIVSQSADTAEKVNAAIAMGFLVETGDNIEMVLRYQGGLLTVNGNPMPLPLGAIMAQ